MFNIETVKELQAMQGTPSVTITLPTYRTSPDNQKDPIRLKNLVTEAVNRLQADYGKRETAELVKKIEEMADGVDNEHNLDGLVLFASADYGQIFKLPYRLPERVAIDDNFLTRDIVYAMNRTPLYWVLMLSEKPTRLYLGQKTDLTEMREFGFPQEYNGPGTGVAVQSGIGANPSREKDRALEAFMRDVDASLSEAIKQGPFPVIVVGLPQNQSSFRSATSNQDFIVNTIDLGLDSLSAHELGKVAWPEVSEALAERRQQIMQDIDVAVSQNKFVTDLDEAWQAALDGRVDVMVVEENHHLPARVSEDGRSLTLLESAQDSDAMTDAVDEMIENVMQQGGRVVFVDDTQLAHHDGLVMLTRY